MKCKVCGVKITISRLLDFDGRICYPCMKAKCYLEDQEIKKIARRNVKKYKAYLKKKRKNVINKKKSTS